jgi:hypothetical protein
LDICSHCSAPAVAGARVCGYCGAALNELVSARDEIIAVSELSSLAMKLKKREAAHLWQHAFVPTTIEAQIAALTQSLSLLQKTTIMSVYRGYTSMALGVFGSAFRAPDINNIALSRCDAILTAMRLASALEPQSTGQVDLAAREVQRARDGLNESKSRVAKIVAWSVLVYFVFMGVIIFGATSVNDGIYDSPHGSEVNTNNFDSEAKNSDQKRGAK